MALLTLRGTPFLYYGDEIGMTDVPVPEDDRLDLVGGGGAEQPSRDGCRTPMQWSADPSAGFTQDGVRPWLPIGDAASRSVAAQREDPGSMLNLCRDLIALRREMPDLRSGRYASIPSPAGVWTWSRGDDTVVSVNLSEEPVTVPIGTATIAIGTRRERDGEPVGGELSLGPWEGAVLRVAPS
jgi:alpha-glucosidase